MYEVHTGSRPGRPTLLLATSGIALAGCLGLAWLQTVDKRALAPGESIAGTPLVVRPPRGWTPLPDERGVFVQRQKDQLAPPRCVAFTYVRHPRFRPPLEVFQEWQWRVDTVRTPPERIRAEDWHVERPRADVTLAGLPAIELRRRRIVQVFTAFNRPDFRYAEDSILRIASHPRGDVIAVEYAPPSEFTDGEIVLMNDICDAVGFTDPALRLSGAEALAAAGLKFPVEKDWTVLGPDFPQAPGVYILATDYGMPAWTVGIHRTWISSSRTAGDILLDHIAARIGEPPDAARLIEWGRLDGVRVVQYQVSYKPGVRRWPHAAWLLWRPLHEAALITVDGEMRPLMSAFDAVEAAARLADTLTFGPADGLPDIAAAEEVGRRCAAAYSQPEPLKEWGRGEMEAAYEGAVGTVAARMLESRAYADRAGQRGYVGGRAQKRLRGGEFSAEKWSIDADGRGYRWTVKRGRGEYERTFVEERKRGSEFVTRSGLYDTGFAVGERFIPPPMAHLAEAWVARTENRDCLIDVSAAEARGVASRLIRRLSAEKDGPPRVLVVNDYWPRGLIAAYDADTPPVMERGPGTTFHRKETPIPRGNDDFADLRNLIDR